jgi:hypothetical protein
VVVYKGVRDVITYDGLTATEDHVVFTTQGLYGSATPPPAVRISVDQEQVGLRYGWVEIISAERRYNARWQPRVQTRCTGCGAEAWILLHSLTGGRSKGCRRCSQPQRIPRWLSIILSNAKRRCTDKTNENWANYGGRGIKFRFPSVVEAGIWVLANLGERPSPQHTLDRIDNDGHYEPGNLRWATRQEQNWNKRDNVLGEWEYHADEWPYSFTTVWRLKREGLTRAEILDRAALAIETHCKNWREIAARLAPLTS